MKKLEDGKQEDRFQRAVTVFKDHGGMLRTAEAIRAGVHPDTLYTMRDEGALEMISRGVYRIADNPPLGNPDLVTVAMRIPNGVVCLISALAFHDITTQIPHEVHIALTRGAKEPRLYYPPLRTYRFADRALNEGVEEYRIDGVNVRVYSPEKTLADCFKFRNKIGLDTAIEALRLYRERRSINVNDIMHFSSVCRVANVMRPYLEAIL
ncbi:type IV toxin-antitoxin system AbiEi family antitoxin domain-containing protein [Thermodesulfobacteriota bacterium]